MAVFREKSGKDIFLWFIKSSKRGRKNWTRKGWPFGILKKGVVRGRGEGSRQAIGEGRKELRKSDFRVGKR